MSRVRGAAPIAVGLLGAVLLVGLLGFSSTLNPIDAILGRGAVVTVPDLQGRPRPGAEADVRSQGLEPVFRSSYSLTGRRGTVIGQDPAPGSRVREGSTVTVVISRGANRVAMPDAVGKPLVDATGPLKEADVKLTIERVPSETVSDGLVISQEPGPGVLLTGADSASFVVSEGPADRAVPEVAGVALAGAAFQVGQAGLVISEVAPTDDPAVLVGAVIRTEPPAGTVVPRDAGLKVFVSAGPPPVALPALVGTPTGAAQNALQAVGFIPNVIAQGSGSSAGGAVTAQEPPAGTVARPGTVVTLTVTGGG